MSFIMLTEVHEKEKEKWAFHLRVSILISVFLVLVFGAIIKDDNLHITQLLLAKDQKITSMSNLEIRHRILFALKDNRYTLNQGLNVADTIIEQAEEKGLPVEKIMGLAKAESNFDPVAVSKKKALGLFQIHPVTWNEYTKKLGLNVSLAAAFDPHLNAFVAITILKDLYDNYKLKTACEEETWKFTLAAYRDGKTGLSRTGLNKTHGPYFAKIQDYEQKFVQ